MSFNTLGLRTDLLSAIAAQGYTLPTPIQTQAIPVALERRDILAGARTGTGKTAAFALPILQHLSESKSTIRFPRALILTPTRELAAQVAESFASYGKHLSLRTTAIFGGVSINPQITMLKRGVDILVATPGRLLDHVNRKTLDLSKIETLVLDEADRMLDMGFIHDIRKIIQYLPENRQNMLFSATYSHEIKRLADGLLNKPALIEVSRRNTAAEGVSHIVYRVPQANKRFLLSNLIREGQWRQVLVFTRTKHGANKLTKQLLSDGVSAAAIHGNKSQTTRTQALADFKCGNVRTLVATDIAARGLDIQHLPHVVNFDLPHVAEDYIHRIGRTGRAGSDGIALSLVSQEEQKLLVGIQHLLQLQIPVKDSGIQLPEIISIPGSPAVRKAAQEAGRKPRSSRWTPSGQKPRKEGGRTTRPSYGQTSSQTSHSRY